MLAFIRGPGTFTTAGQIYLKMLPEGDVAALTNDTLVKMSPVFSPDGSRIAYTAIGEGNGNSTFVVPTLRGEPRLWLSNASGLTWIGRNRVLYSWLQAGHMKLVTGGEGGADAHDVYVPPDERGMAHRSALSPDGTSVLAVEMDGGGRWMPCRLLPFDRSSTGKQVGPVPGRCTDTGWSPDGKWMYFTADHGDGFHVWRQAYPDGTAEELTPGPTDEEGLAIAHDGRSIITSVGIRRRGVWIHDRTGQRQVSGEGFAFQPLLSGDGRIVCYRVAQTMPTGQMASELWMTDLASGRSERLLPGYQTTSYDVSTANVIVAAVPESDGTSQLWLAPLDKHEAPHRIASLRGDNPRFVSGDTIVYREVDGKAQTLVRIHADGTARRVLRPAPSYNLGSVSPDGRWLSVGSPGGILEMVSTEDGATLRVIADQQRSKRARWSRDGSELYLSIQIGAASAFGDGYTYVVPLRNGMLPLMPRGGFQSESEIAALPGVQRLEYADVGPGPAAGVYAYSAISMLRNLYRIPLPR
jgi:Tol biopolymer transport system component